MPWKRIVPTKSLDNAGSYFSINAGDKVIFVAEGVTVSMPWMRYAPTPNAFSGFITHQT